MRPIYLISKTSHDSASDVIHIPILSIVYLHPPIDFSRYDGIIITSKEGAKALGFYDIDWEKIDILCVGESTAQEVKILGGRNITIASGYGESLLEILENHSTRWLYLRPKMIASSWPSQARMMGKKIDEVIIYETSCNAQMKSIPIADDGVLIFTSPSSIECFLERYSFHPSHSVIVIGKTTQKALPSDIESYMADATTIDACVNKAREIAISHPF